MSGENNEEPSSTLDKADDDLLDRSFENSHATSIPSEDDVDDDDAITAIVKPELLSRLEQERHYSKINHLEVESHWRKILRRDKLTSLQNDIQNLSQSFQDEITRKEKIIQLLHVGFEQAEDQFQRATAFHLQSISTLIDLHDDRLLSLERDFESNLTTLQNDSTAELATLTTSHERSQRLIEEKISALLADEDNAIAKDKRDRDNRNRHTTTNTSLSTTEPTPSSTSSTHHHHDDDDDPHHRHLENVNSLRAALESRIEELERRFETSRSNYLQLTERRTADVATLRENERRAGDRARKLSKIVERCRGAFQRQACDHEKIMGEERKRNESLMERKRRALWRYRALKERMNGVRGKRRGVLLTVTKSARGAKESLRDMIDQADRIVAVYDLCRKMETDRERVVPYLTTEDDRRLEEQAERMMRNWRRDAMVGVEGEEEEGVVLCEGSADDSSSGQDVVDGIVVEEGSDKDQGNRMLRENKWSCFNVFWKKYNKVLLDALIVEREEKRLKKEHGRLQNMLKKYMDGISVNDDVIRSNNPLLVVNGRVNPSSSPHSKPSSSSASTFVACSPSKTVTKTGIKARKLTIVDANHVVATSTVRDHVY